jgi:hypothetical protein
VVGAKGFEPSTSWSRTRRASQAALRPEIDLRNKGIACVHLKDSTGVRVVAHWLLPYKSFRIGAFRRLKMVAKAVSSLLNG